MTKRKVNPRSIVANEKQIGAKVRVRRVECHMSQTALAKILGVSFQQVQKYEKGMNRIGAGRLEDIASALDVPVSFFYANGKQHKDASEINSLLAKDPRLSIRLLRAYDAIEDQGLQRHFVKLLEGVAGLE